MLELTTTPTTQVKVGHDLDQSCNAQLRGPERAHQHNEQSQQSSRTNHRLLRGLSGCICFLSVIKTKPNFDWVLWQWSWLRQLNLEATWGLTAWWITLSNPFQWDRWFKHILFTIPEQSLCLPVKIRLSRDQVGFNSLMNFKCLLQYCQGKITKKSNTGVQEIWKEHKKIHSVLNMIYVYKVLMNQTP